MRFPTDTISALISNSLPQIISLTNQLTEPQTMISESIALIFAHVVGELKKTIKLIATTENFWKI
jgi:hypothetical protein